MAGQPLPSPPTPPGDLDPALGIGARLTVYRAARGLTITALARDVGVSPSLISQIERGQSRPSVSTLFALAQALELPVDAFFRDAPQEPVRAADAFPPALHPTDRYVVRGPQRATIDIEGGVRWERLTPGALDELEFMELVYAPGAESHHELYRHPGMELVLVLEGRLEILVAFEHYELGPGDSICFPSTQPHRYHNPTDETARAVTVILRDGGLDNRRRP